MKREEVAKLIDISSVKTISSQCDVDEIIDAAREHNFICVFPNPCFISYTIAKLSDRPDILVGGVCGFPSGSELTSTKVEQAKEHKSMGCHEIDMVMNIGMLKSGNIEYVVADIEAVYQAVEPLPLKVIIETPLLSDEEIKLAASIVSDSPALFVKTGTGWSGETTIKHVELINEVIDHDTKVKVAGGVRDLKSLMNFKQMGVSRFGIGCQSALNIIEEEVGCHSES